MLRNHSSILKACSAFALLQVKPLLVHSSVAFLRIVHLMIVAIIKSNDAFQHCSLPCPEDDMQLITRTCCKMQERQGSCELLLHQHQPLLKQKFLQKLLFGTWNTTMWMPIPEITGSIFKVAAFHWDILPM